MEAAARGSKRRAGEAGVAASTDQMSVTMLGAGNEVGRSCIVLRFKGKTIMFDCGIQPSETGLRSLPYLDDVDPKDIDILFISHFHVDHAAGLPYFTEKLPGFRGRIFATHSTAAVMRILLSDYVRVSNLHSDNNNLYSEEDVTRCLSRIELVDFKQSKTVDGIKFMLYPAGHVLGAAMVYLEVDGVRVLYTGDYSMDDDRHLMQAEAPVDNPPNVLIIESTFGLQKHESREVREARFIESVRSTVVRGGKALIPVYALGRAQELMLILEEYWEEHPEMQRCPIYFSSKIASKSLEVYKTFISQMNSKIQAQMLHRNPWEFRHIRNLENPRDLREYGQCIVFASPGMLQSGLSRDLFEAWCEDSKNTVLLTGYSVENTLAHHLLSSPRVVESSKDGRKLSMNATVEHVSFAAHADIVATSTFIDSLRPPNIILVHGEKNQMRRLHSHLASKYQARAGYSIFMPPNGAANAVLLEFQQKKHVRAIGALAAAPHGTGDSARGVLVRKDFEYVLVAPEDVSKHAQMTTMTMRQTLHIPYRNAFSWLEKYVRAMHEEVQQVPKWSGDEEDDPTVVLPRADTEPPLETFDLLVCGVVRVECRPPDRVVLHWMSSPGADVVADSLVAVIAHADVSAACMKLRAKCCGGSGGSHAGHAHSHDGSCEKTDEAPASEEAKKKLLADLDRLLGPK